MLLKGFKWGRVTNEWMRTEKFPLGWSAWWSLDFWPVTRSSTSRVHIPWYIGPSALYLLCWCLGLPTTEIWGEEHIFLILSSRWHVTLITSKGRVLMAGPSYKCVSSLQLGHFPREEMLYNQRNDGIPTSRHSFFLSRKSPEYTLSWNVKVGES